MEKYYGNYLGLVVNDQDPEGRDRVQIYVPGVTNTIYDNWNNNNKNKSIGIDIGSTFTLNEEILKKLRNVLPWAEKATPLIGPGTSMYHQEGSGASSAPIEPSGDDFIDSVPVGNTVDRISTDGLSDIMKSSLSRFKSTFKNSTITSGKRDYIPEGGSPTSLHLSGNAVDIAMPSSSTEQERVVQWWMQNGATEIGWEGNHIHVGFRQDNKKSVFWRNSPRESVKTNLAGSPSWFQNIGEQFKKGQISSNNYINSEIPPTAAKSGEADVSTETGPKVVTTKVKPSDGTASSIPDIPDSVSPSEGTPQGTRSTTRTLSKVWLFFYGGDIQKPVFFAYSLPPNETYAHNNVNVDNNSSGSGSSGANIPLVDDAPLPTRQDFMDTVQEMMPNNTEIDNSALNFEIDIPAPNVRGVTTTKIPIPEEFK